MLAAQRLRARAGHRLHAHSALRQAPHSLQPIFVLCELLGHIVEPASGVCENFACLFGRHVLRYRENSFQLPKGRHLVQPETIQPTRCKAPGAAPNMPRPAMGKSFIFIFACPSIHQLTLLYSAGSCSPLRFCSLLHIDMRISTRKACTEAQCSRAEKVPKDNLNLIPSFLQNVCNP